MFGLGMLTASISWLLSTQPILRNRRAFAHEILATLEGIRDEGGLHTIPASELATILAHFSEGVLQMRSDLEHTPGAYYFHSDDERTSLPVQLPALPYPSLRRLISTADGRPLTDDHALTRSPDPPCSALTDQRHLV